jgi:hypothetical protein
VFTEAREIDSERDLLGSTDATPGMLLGRGFRMAANEMMQDMQQGTDMIAIILGLCFANVVDDHLAHGLETMLPIDEILRVGRRNYLRDMFMLGNRQHLLFGEATHANAVFERNHAFM